VMSGTTSCRARRRFDHAVRLRPGVAAHHAPVECVGATAVAECLSSVDGQSTRSVAQTPRHNAGCGELPGEGAASFRARWPPDPRLARRGAGACSADIGCTLFPRPPRLAPAYHQPRGACSAADSNPGVHQARRRGGR
jgi:hypothetical protein